MAHKQDEIKTQLDRFLAFSFASADLFLEVSGGGRITFIAGAVKSLSGATQEDLLDSNWLHLFAQSDRPKVKKLKDDAQIGRRGGPVIAKFSGELGGDEKAIVSAILMPKNRSLYVAIGFMKDTIANLINNPDALLESSDTENSDVINEPEKKEEEHLLNKDEFIQKAIKSMEEAKNMNEEVDFTFIDIPDVENIRDKYGDDVWEHFVEKITETLALNSIDGQTAGEIEEGKYSVLHDKSVKSDNILEQLISLAKEQDPDGEGFEVSGATVEADTANFNERDTTKAILYTMSEFEKKGAEIDFKTLNTSFKSYLDSNTSKIKQFKSIVEQLDFNLYFQPIVDMETKDISHFEMLTRFREGGTQEWIMFGEDIGMAAEFDISVCERAVNYVIYKAGGRRTIFAVNLSGQSIQNEAFFKKLCALLDRDYSLKTRLMFEITESNLIDDLGKANKYIQQLRKKGFKVCLDDFGAGAASFQYIQSFDVDYVKLDGAYTEKIMHSERDLVLVRNMVQMCNDLNTPVIAERVETQEEANKLLELGINKGQGFLFAEPSPTPPYDLFS